MIPDEVRYYLRACDENTRAVIDGLAGTLFCRRKFWGFRFDRGLVLKFEQAELESAVVALWTSLVGPLLHDGGCSVVGMVPRRLATAANSACIVCPPIGTQRSVDTVILVCTCQVWRSLKCVSCGWHWFRHCFCSGEYDRWRESC